MRSRRKSSIACAASRPACQALDRLPWCNKAFSELNLNRLAEAEATIRRATERKLELPEYVLARYFIAFLNSDVEDMKRKAVLATGKRSTEDMISHVEALVLARSGRLQEARRKSASAVSIATQSGQRERAALFEAATAVWEAFFGNAAAARKQATEALGLARGREVDYAVASRWPFRAMSRDPGPLPTTSRRAFLRIHRFNTSICRRFEPCSH